MLIGLGDINDYDTVYTLLRAEELLEMEALTLNSLDELVSTSDDGMGLLSL